MNRPVPQPTPDRMVSPAGHPIVVGIVPGQPSLVLLTGAAWAVALGASELVAAYVDPSRITTAEHLDGSISHVAIDPDADDHDWADRAEELEQACAKALEGIHIPWRFHYLAGRPDRALTHLARVIDAAGFVVGATTGHRVRTWVEGTVSERLSRHQHRPVLTVPVRVVDWKAEPTRV